jgi:N-acetylmuramoyl-L-alanine amidase
MRVYKASDVDGCMRSSERKSHSTRHAALLFTLVSCVLLVACSGCSRAKNNKSGESSQKAQSAASSMASSAASSSESSSAPSAVPSTPESVPQTNAAKHVICIDPGHQILVDMTEEPEAPNSNIMKVQNPGGAEGIVTKMPEYQLDLAVSLKMEQQLKAQGYTVVMTRETNDVNIGNIDRAKIANNCNADLFVRVHADGVDDQTAHGISILVPGSQFVTDANLRAESRKAAQYLMNGMIAATGAYNRGLVETDDMTGLNWCTRPMMLVEMGFMSNPDEDVAMSTDAYQNKLAAGMVNGINNYFANK